MRRKIHVCHMRRIHVACAVVTTVLAQLGSRASLVTGSGFRV